LDFESSAATPINLNVEIPSSEEILSVEALIRSFILKQDLKQLLTLYQISKRNVNKLEKNLAGEPINTKIPVYSSEKLIC
jgi:hypothetical protein